MVQCRAVGKVQARRAMRQALVAGRTGVTVSVPARRSEGKSVHRRNFDVSFEYRRCG